MAIRHTSEINRYAYYVHYTATGYIKQQSLPIDGSLSAYAIKKVQNRSRQLSTRISKDVKEEYAKTISMLYGRKSGSQVSLEEQQWKNFYDGLMKVLIDKEFLGVTSSTFMQKETGRLLSSSKSGKGKKIKKRQYLTKNQILELFETVNRINNEINRINLQDGKLSQQKQKRLSSLKGLLKLLESRIERVMDLETKQIKETANPTYFNFWKNDPPRYDMGEDFIDEVNEKLAQCGLMYITLTTAQGFAGESIGAVAAEMMTGLALKGSSDEIQKIIKNINQERVTGEKQLPIIYNKVSEDMQKYISFLKDRTIRENNTIISAHASQQKIDIQVELPKNLKNPRIKTQAGISMKSVDLRNAIGLVSGTNLWYLINNENIKTFLRPYLNIMAGRLGDGSQYTNIGSGSGFNINKIAMSIDKSEGSNAKRIKALRNDAFNAIKILTAYKALSGDTLGREKNVAQLFVVNDVNGRKTYVLEIADIMKAILNNIIKNKSAIDDYFEFSFNNVIDLILDNFYQPTIAERMAGIIESAHRQKLSISMKPSVILGPLLGKKNISG